MHFLSGSPHFRTPNKLCKFGRTRAHSLFISHQDLINASKHFVIFTGAGISTAANIPDFRGPGGLNSKGILGLKEHELDVVMPTYSHLVIKHLLQRGIAKFLVTSNHDDLHAKSGCDLNQIAELFGNAYIERCLKCNTLFRRQVVTPNLGRKCDNATCGGRLVKTGVRFGGAVPEAPLALAQKNARKCDVALVLGSSMTVSPFCDLAGTAPSVGIVSIQDTPVDKLPKTLKFNSTCDSVMREIAKSLGIVVEDFVYRATFYVTATAGEAGEVKIRLHGKPNEPVNCVGSATAKLGEAEQAFAKVGLGFEALLPAGSGQVTLTIQWQPEYKEEDKEMAVIVDGVAHEIVFEHCVSFPV